MQAIVSAANMLGAASEAAWYTVGEAPPRKYQRIHVMPHLRRNQTGRTLRSRPNPPRAGMLWLEFTSDEFAESLRRDLPSFPVDAVLNATPGAIAGLLLGHDSVGVLALAAVTWVSSSGIVARLLGDLRRLRDPAAPAVLAVLVLEDFGYQPDRASTHDSLSATSLRRPHTRTSPDISYRGPLNHDHLTEVRPYQL
ncbi:hypothetical protein [Pseudonocardia alaniniphila]|uniref:Uncharacterized protein n=1 Tax=Pseudonocardia alaniniphila TaxID=75291 RepID=A0ABS9TAW1_9PSEU|nr:hypothetical protein [Pseudonocardia alaniniphila]MCH6165676.1 hypothetical protein [Pseudonocardia alaniniphila]